MGIIILLSCFIGLLRFIVPSHELSWPGTYEAFAHIFVGALLLCSFSYTFSNKTRWIAGVSLITITMIELLVFLNR